jgi:hypothetical protein
VIAEDDIPAAQDDGPGYKFFQGAWHVTGSFFCYAKVRSCLKYYQKAGSESTLSAGVLSSDLVQGQPTLRVDPEKLM